MRAAIRELKRAARAGMCPGATGEAVHVAQEAALALLQRSVAMGHDRLALLRLADALQLGAVVDAGILAYCRRIAAAQARPGEAAGRKIQSAR
ncbi:hypothetical protein ACX12L_05115 [Alicycliphilus sp. T452]